MGETPDNPACALSHTDYCRELNMHACASCTVRGSADMDEIRRDIDLYRSLLPAGGVARLFEARTCRLCKGETKGKRHGYAILDMAHPEPKRVQQWLLGKRQLRVGTMIPLQFAVCKTCRRRYLILEYLPLAVPLLTGFVALIAFTADAVRVPLATRSTFLPFGLWLMCVLLAMLLSRLIADFLKRRWQSALYTDVLEHPVVAEMLDLGWTPIAAKARTKLLFSKTRLKRGLGTAPSVADEARDGENGQKPRIV